MIRWTDDLRKHLPPGRGVGQLPPPRKKPHSLTKLWNDAHTGFGAKARTFLKSRHGLSALVNRTVAVFAHKGKVANNPDWDSEVFGLAMQVGMASINDWESDAGGTYKILRYAMARGGRETMEAWLYACRIDLKVESSWQVGKRVCTTALELKDRPELGRAFDNRYGTHPVAKALDELRLLLALADQAEYDAAVEVARESWDLLTPRMKAMMVYLLPTLVDEAVALASTGSPDHRQNWWAWLAMTGRQPTAFAALASGASWNAAKILYPLAACGEEAVPVLVGFAKATPDYAQAAVGPLACIVCEESASFLAGHTDVDHARAFFLENTELAMRHLPEGDAVRDEVVRSNPELNPDAKPTVDDAALPELFRRPVKSKLKEFEVWKLHNDLVIRGTDTVLSPAQFEQLGKVLCKAKGRLPPADRSALQQLFDPDSAQLFATALADEYLAQGYYKTGKWTFRSLMVFGGNETVDRLGTAAAKMDYPNQCAVVEILEGIGSEHALIRVAHFANKGRGRGFKNAAKSAMNRIARAKGLDNNQLQDRLVPKLGLDDKGRLHLDYGPRSFTVGFDEKLKPFVIDDKGKKRVNLPKPGKKDDPELAPVSEKRWKTLKKDVRTIASTQISRFEESLRIRRRWEQDEFQKYLVTHPLIGHLTRRLVWGIYTLGGKLLVSFRVDEEHAWLDAEDEAIDKAAGQIGLVHPLQLTAEERAAWGEVLADYEIMQPFPQLSRPVYPPDSEDSNKVLQELDGATILGGHLFRLLNAGWTRGGVQDAGQWYEAWTAGEGFNLTVATDHGVNIGGGYGTDEPSTVTLKVRSEGPEPVAWSEAVLDLTHLLS
jgi:hypothetical protein